jgi:glucan-binding YG repeat protein
MKPYKKLFFIAASAAICLAVSVPAAAFADEPTDTPSHFKEWVTDNEGRIFYYDDTGTTLTGEHEIDGEIYLFSKNGVLKTGWRTVGGKRRYYEPETGKPLYGRFTVCGEEFYIEHDEGKLTDTIYKSENGDLYLVGEKGSFICDEGRVEKDGYYYGITENGTLATGFALISDIPYIFDEDGKQKLGWAEDNGREYYYDIENGEIKLGLINIENSCYYIDINDGKKKGVVDINGVEYYFSDITGKLQTGFVDINGNTKFFYEDGTYAVGLTEIDGKNYLFNESGVRLSGLNTVNGNLYYSDDEGILLNGIITIDKDTYYFAEDYSAKSGLLEIEGAKYLFGSDFRMLTGKQEYNGDYYCFDTISGKMLTGLLEDNGDYFYFDTNSGKMLTGMQLIDDKKYYFNTETGKMINGFVKLEDGTYHFGEDGAMTTGWLTIGENKYYFNETNGIMATNTIKDGFNLNEDGIAVPFSALQEKAQTIIDEKGKDTNSIYNYVRGNNKYKLMEKTRTLEEINQMGWSYFANYALSNRFVVCYYFAAATDLLLRQAGYECRIVYGTGRGTSDHYWNEVYDPTTKTWLSYDTCNGYYGVTFEYLQTQNYTFKQHVHPKYY